MQDIFRLPLLFTLCILLIQSLEREYIYASERFWSAHSKKFFAVLNCIITYRYFLKGFGTVISEDVRPASLSESQIQRKVLEIQSTLENVDEKTAHATLHSLFFDLHKPSTSLQHCSYSALALTSLFARFGVNCEPLNPTPTEYSFIEDFYQVAEHSLEAAFITCQKRNHIVCPEISNAARYIEERFTASVTFDDIAMNVGFNKTCLCKRFKEDMGITIHEYLLRKCIESAKTQLTNTPIGISAISESTGFL